MWPRLRRDPMTAEKGGPKRARAAVRQILDEEDFVIHVKKLRDKSWGRRRGEWVAWVELCGEDEFGMLARGDHPERAVVRLAADFQRVVHRARNPERYDERGNIKKEFL